MSLFHLVAISPDPTTFVLVGPEGLVWRHPATGRPAYILAARTLAERQKAVAHIADSLGWGLPLHGLAPGRHKCADSIDRALGGCFWVPWSKAPAPVATNDDPLPQQVMVVADVQGRLARPDSQTTDSYIVRRLRRLRAKAAVLCTLWRQRQHHAAVYCLLFVW